MIGGQTVQCTRSVLMIKPTGFAFHEETAASNTFQKRIPISVEELRNRVGIEYGNMVRALAGAGVDVVSIDPFDSAAPDAVFPNNWFSTHTDGSLVFYPMLAEKRRSERSAALTNVLKKNGFAVRRVIDLSPLERVDAYLEGTGSLVLDRESRVAYAALSPRTCRQAIPSFEKRTGFEVVAFNVANKKGHAIYHTNVMMSVGKHVAIVCPNVFTERAEYDQVIERLTANMKQVVTITEEQMNAFCANVLEVQDQRGESLFVMSHGAYRALQAKQRAVLNLHGRILPVDIPTIESVGGGGVRCMLAEIFLPRTKKRS